MRGWLPAVLVAFLPHGCSCSAPDNHLYRSIPPPCPGDESMLIEVEFPPSSACVQLLVVVDNSMGMTDVQEAVADAFPSLYEVLFEQYPITPSGESIILGPYISLHLGVLSTDMGTGGYDTSGGGCSDWVDGDNGELLHEPSSLVSGCESIYPHYASFDQHSDFEFIAETFRCLTVLGEDGCAFEQHLEALRKAIVENREDVNRGFPADNSMLVVLFITEEDDCSISPGNEWVFDPDDTSLGPMCCRCNLHPEAHEPVATYIDVLRALWPEPGSLLVAMIAGVPPGDQCEGMGDEIVGCLDHPNMSGELDPTGEPGPSCTIPASGLLAFPSRRLVQVAQALGSDAIVGSVCNDDYSPIMRDIGTIIRDRIYPPPLPEMLPMDRISDDPCFCEAPCVLVETFPDDGPCEPFVRCYEPEGEGTGCALLEDEDGLQHSLCMHDQLASLVPCEYSCDDPDAPRSYIGGRGWVYLPDAFGGPRIAFTGGLESDPTLHLSCCL